MKNPLATLRRFAPTLALGAALAGCTSLVTVPDAANDRAPVITVHSLPSGPGVVTPGESQVTVAEPVRVSENTPVLITVDAASPGGVKRLWVSGYQGGNKLWEVQITGAPNSQGLVPRTLSILGHDGNGGIGGQPLLLAPGALYHTAVVHVEATNFNNQTRSLDVGYEVLPAPLLR